MSKASICYTGRRSCSQNPTMNRESYMFMMRVIRREMERRNGTAKHDFRAAGSERNDGNV